MSRTTKIETEKLVDSIDRLSSIETLINRKDLSSSFYDMESLFREINFIHANCLNYKESMNSIYDNISYIKSRLSHLNETLTETVNSVNSIEEVTIDKLVELSNIYQDTPAGNCLINLARQKSFLNSLSSLQEAKEITKIPAPTQPVEEDSGINTVPIGIAIGATGVLGSIGAVAVNEIYGSESKRKKSSSDVVLDEYNEEEDYSYGPKKITPANTPYHAAREMRESERFYGNELEDFPYIKDDNK